MNRNDSRSGVNIKKEREKDGKEIARNGERNTEA